MIGILPLPYRAPERQLEVVVPTDWRCAIGMYSLLDHFANIDWCSKLCACAINNFHEYVIECELIYFRELIHWHYTYVEALLIPLTVLAPKRPQCTHMSIAYCQLFYNIRRQEEEKREGNFKMTFLNIVDEFRFVKVSSAFQLQENVSICLIIWMQQLVCIIALP